MGTCPGLPGAAGPPQSQGPARVLMFCQDYFKRKLIIRLQIRSPETSVITTANLVKRRRRQCLLSRRLWEPLGEERRGTFSWRFFSGCTEACYRAGDNSKTWRNTEILYNNGFK